MAGTWQWIKPNQAATNYEFRATLSPTAVSNAIGQDGVGVRVVSIMDCQYGRLYPVSGFRIGCVYYLDPATAATYWQVLLHWPFYGIEWEVFGAGLPALESKARVTEVTLEHDCNAWTFEGVELTWYINGGTTARETFALAGPHSGDGYRLINNCGVWSHFADFVAGEFSNGHIGPEFTPQLPPCPPSEIEVTGTGAAVYGFRWEDPLSPGYAAEPIEIETLTAPTPVQNPGCPACSCIGTYPTLSGTDSWNLNIGSVAESYASRLGAPGNGVCKCRDGSESGLIGFGLAENTGIRRRVSGRLNSESAGITRHRMQRRAGCFCAWPLTTENYTNIVLEDDFLVTKIAYDAISFRWEGVKYCWAGIGVCPEPPFPSPPFAICPGYEDELCIYDGLLSVGWIDPGCGGGSLHLTTAPGGLMFAAQVEASALRCWRFDLKDHDATLDVLAITAGSAQIAYGPDGQVHIVYEEAGTVKRVRSSGIGEGWSSPETVGIGTYPAIAVGPDGGVFVLLHNGTHWRCYRRDLGDVAFVDLGVNISSASAGTAALEWSPLLKHGLVAILVDGGTAYRLESTSRGESWSGAVSTGASGSHPAFAVDPLSGIESLALAGGANWDAWRKHPEGAWEKVAEDFLAAAASAAGLEYHPDDKHRLVFVVNDGGTRRRLVSSSEGQTWENAS